MVLINSPIAILASALLASATPTKLTPSLNSLDNRQIYDLPEGYTYWIEWYPNGCGNGASDQLSGAEETLAQCRTVRRFDENPPTSSSVRIVTRPEDTRVFHWQLFGGNDCSTQIHAGQGAGCFTVPMNQRVGAVIVYT